MWSTHHCHYSNVHWLGIVVPVIAPFMHHMFTWKLLALNSLTRLLIWFGLVSWHISHCKLFNDKSIFVHLSGSISNNSVWNRNSFVLHDPWIGPYQVLPLLARVNLRHFIFKAPLLLDTYHHIVGVFYPSAETQSVYSTAPADWVRFSHGWDVTHAVCLKQELPGKAIPLPESITGLNLEFSFS